MILPDVNVLVYAFRVSAPQHARWVEWLNEVRARSELALVDLVALGVIRVVTNPRIFSPPAPAREALAFVDQLRGSPLVRELHPTDATWKELHSIIARDDRVRGKVVPDAWLAALAISHGCRLATADRGFGRFDGLDWFVPVETS